MNKLIKYIGIGLLVGWVVALIANFTIYQETTMQLTFIHPIVDGILFMAVMIAIYFAVVSLYRKNESQASIVLGTVGTISMVLAIAFYFYI
ncbi:riboflavin transporter FmnP [Evansella vedderi]|uniref:Riboflavin transporter FmnP n=1 Tax=Evansella vedderi TaxID=38282 RepID=A0ABU0A008_9BACI|nr:hypothetical protein [Evansella vedderi]MDQ0256550.1 riboflavin transporter FmnP [Evansella vedderi]